MFQQPNLIGQNAPSQFNPALNPIQQARASGAVMEYKFLTATPKKQLKELTTVLKAEPKKFLGIKYGKKFNLKDRCVVCGFHHIWESGDYLRPPMPLDKVVKGRPLMGTYCPKHSAMYMQLEMLQQQVLAEKHGLEFKRFVPKVPKVIKSGPLETLSKKDVMSLTSAGWFITPPAVADTKKANEEVLELMTRITLMTERINYLLMNNKIETIEEKEE
tara:strand:+ start:5632 stop:6282 length:651 start_codon:yes stop_codon:yes gene_type:complete